MTMKIKVTMKMIMKKKINMTNEHEHLMKKEDWDKDQKNMKTSTSLLAEDSL